MANFHFVTAQRSGVEFIRQRRESSPRYEEIPQMRDFQFMALVVIVGNSIRIVQIKYAR